MGCVKLWILYPGPPNYKDYERCAREQHILLKVYRELKGAIAMVTGPDLGITLPSIFTLRGGLTPGLEFSSSQSMGVAKQAYAMNKRIQTETSAAEQQALIEAIIMGFRSSKTTCQRSAAQHLCSHFAGLKRLSGYKRIFQELMDAASHVSDQCRCCGERWVGHSVKHLHKSQAQESEP